MHAWKWHVNDFVAGQILALTHPKATDCEVVDFDARKSSAALSFLATIGNV